MILEISGNPELRLITTEIVKILASDGGVHFSEIRPHIGQIMSPYRGPFVSGIEPINVHNVLIPVVK